MVPTSHPAILIAQLLLAVLEFWAIGQFGPRPIRFAVGMTVLNLLYVIFHVAIGAFVLALVCLVMAYRHGKNAYHLGVRNLAIIQPSAQEK